MSLFRGISILLGIVFSGFAWGASPSPKAAIAVPSPPELKALLKPEVFARLNQDREIQAYAKLEEDRYHFYSAMSVRGGVQRARETLTDYALYQKMVPFVSKSEAVGPLLRLEGGVFGWRLSSLVRIDTVAPNWLKYRIVGGHLTGLSGQVIFQQKGERETLVYFDGELHGKNWPPAFVMERGAEIVFGLTAERMRSCIEKRDIHGESKSESSPKAGSKEGQEGLKTDSKEVGKESSKSNEGSSSKSSAQESSKKGDEVPQPRVGLPKTD